MKRFRITRTTEGVTRRLDYETELNPEQLGVVLHPDGPVLVIAGAGTGKTRTVTYRVARLLETGVPPSKVLLLTFTNKAAREMMNRVQRLAETEVRGLWGGTFHHIGNRVLRRHAGLLGYRDGFSILDREDQKELLESCISEVKGTEEKLPKGAVLAEILSYHRNTLIDLEELINGRYPYLMNISAELIRTFGLYELRKHQMNLMDFDDLLINMLRLLEEHNELTEYYSSRFRYILVDEYQDINILQARIVDNLAKTHRNLMVVGDDAQSIYSFRGARAEVILNFPQRYPDATVFKLTTNYRSIPEILALSNASISHNVHQFHKDLSSVRPPGERPMVIGLNDLYEQAEFTASRIIELLETGVPAEDIAVLYRSHYQSLEVQLELTRRGIPFEVRSGLRFFEQAHIKDILSFLRILQNPYDELSWKRILKMVPHIGNVTANKVWEFIYRSDRPLQSIRETTGLIPRKASGGFSLFLSTIDGLKETDYRDSPEEAISYILEHGYLDYLHNTYPNAEGRREDIEQLIRYAGRYSSERGLTYSKLELLLSDLTLESINEGTEEGGGETEVKGVVLSSVHQAKGLEWPYVFIIGLNEGRFPSKKAIITEGEEEERRLFYVACTRAMNELYLCYTLTDNGYSPFINPSRFITELPGEVYEEVEIE